MEYDVWYLKYHIYSDDYIIWNMMTIYDYIIWNMMGWWFQPLRKNISHLG